MRPKKRNDGAELPAYTLSGPFYREKMRGQECPRHTKKLGRMARGWVAQVRGLPLAAKLGKDITLRFAAPPPRLRPGRTETSAMAWR